MSEILKALKASEQEHQRYDAVSTVTINQSASTEPKASRMIIAMAFTAPVILTVSWLSYDTYQRYQQHQVSSSVVVNAEPEIIEVESTFLALPYLDKSDLKTTQVRVEPVSIIAMSDAADVIGDEQNVSQPVTTKPSADTSNLNTAEEPVIDDLSQLDLSQFSPELAQRVQSAFSNSDSSLNVTDQNSNSPSESLQNAMEGNVTRNAIKLSQRGADFVGSLPAMNFQTHVYSSRTDKRWVKINGTEFSEGDRVNSDVTLVAIEQRYCTIEYQGQLIEVPALYDWKG
ncbi:general secretion pathway protein GspB [Vibrio lamellibrachiae]|uniref:general secretion pathway protein GspB n=1 Tax=Vibrio lamellibrachiae TaxID=2910253 RepID=UPI003D0F1EE5